MQKPLQPSPELAEIVGAAPIARGQVVSKVWDYIRIHKLQNSADKREILADDTGIELLIARLEEADEDEVTWDA